MSAKVSQNSQPSGKTPASATGAAVSLAAQTSSHKLNISLGSSKSVPAPKLASSAPKGKA
jgi:hypothetical protein